MKPLVGALAHTAAIAPFELLLTININRPVRPCRQGDAVTVHGDTGRSVCAPTDCRFHCIADRRGFGPRRKTMKQLMYLGSLAIAVALVILAPAAATERPHHTRATGHFISATEVIAEGYETHLG